MKKWLAMLLAAALCISVLPVFAAQAATGTICETCYGTGKNPCTWCNGTGKMGSSSYRYTCVSCGGTGAMACLGRCGGDGIIENNSANSGGIQRQGSICGTCYGTGTVVCSWCNGTGVMQYGSFSYTCSCGGTGVTSCYGGCGGDGVIENNPGINPIYPMPSMNPNGNCVICKGTGQKICPSCDGLGSQSKTGYAPNFGFGSSTYGMNSRCYACNGSGVVMCTYCLGDGVQ